MDQLINQIVQRTGISPDQAREAVRVTVDFVKDRLPAPVAAQVDNTLSGQSTGQPGAGDTIAERARRALGDIGGMFGRPSE